MSLTRDEARDAVEVVRQAARDREDEAVRQRARSLELEVDEVYESVLDDVDGLIDEAIAAGSYEINWEVDDHEVSQALRSRLAEHYRVMGYDVRPGQETRDMGDSAAPCVEDRLTLSIYWR